MKGYSRRFSISGAAHEKHSIESSTVGFMYASMTAAFGKPVRKHEAELYYTEHGKVITLQAICQNYRLVPENDANKYYVLI